MSIESKENIIYSPEGEGPQEKQAAKEYEESARKESEHRLHAVSKEEAEERVEEADKIRKKSRGLMEGSFRDWWEGQKGGEGAKKLAEWCFENIATAINYDCLNEPDTNSLKAYFKQNIEPSINRLVQEVLERGAQEDIVHYFSDELKSRYGNELSQKVWETYQDYLNKAFEASKERE